jgi:hypothetical protein
MNGMTLILWIIGLVPLYYAVRYGLYYLHRWTTPKKELKKEDVAETMRRRMAEARSEREGKQ